MHPEYKSKRKSGQKTDLLHNTVRRRKRQGQRKSRWQRSDTSSEKEQESKETNSSTPPPIIINNHFFLNNSPVTFGCSRDNKYYFDMPAKLYAIKDGMMNEEETRKLQEKIKNMVRENKPRITSLEDILKECDAKTTGVGDGCVRVTWRFRSLEGLRRFWKMYLTGDLKRCLQKDLPIETVKVSENDYQMGCKFFGRSGKITGQAVIKRIISVQCLDQHLNTLEQAAVEYVRRRKALVEMLRGVACDYTRSTVQKILAEFAVMLVVAMVTLLTTLAFLSSTYAESDFKDVLTVHVYNVTVIHIRSHCYDKYENIRSYLMYALVTVLLLFTGIGTLLKTYSRGSDEVDDKVGDDEDRVTSAKMNSAPVIWVFKDIGEHFFRLFCFCIVLLMLCLRLGCTDEFTLPIIWETGFIMSGIAAVIFFILAVFCGILSIYTKIKVPMQYHSDIEACEYLRCAFKTVKLVSELMQKEWRRIAGAEAEAKRMGNALDITTEVETLKFQVRDTSVESASESIIDEATRASIRSGLPSSDALFSVIQVPCNLQGWISSSAKDRKIPPPEVNKFVNDLADKINCPAQEDMKTKIRQIRCSLGRE
ncbi:uncharacterized protein LOC110988373 [Acanthaster planci]|uniref:Uncharacterized protein LOC110988373 n=1 Tax=Acanthaster planci TaxID=133434 RepID=A0A8B7ZQ29_ACAPL|nr:uncharacterized protein LOC110988373 [Acanthaster planci]XP_022107508.1 uncharacterized protein LOC110988373 [Acanthaster planci]